MWFKNLLLYRFTSPFDHSTEELNQRLEKFAFSPCRSHDTSKYGWVSPMGELSDELQFSAQGRILLCARREASSASTVAVDEDGRAHVVDSRGVVRRFDRNLADFEVLGIGDDPIGGVAIDGDAIVAAGGTGRVAVVGASDGYVRSLRPDGATTWLVRIGAAVAGPPVARAGTAAVRQIDGGITLVRDGLIVSEVVARARSVDPPALDASGMVFRDGEDVVAVFPQGEEAWRQPAVAAQPGLALGEDVVVIRGVTDLRALDRRTGSVLWQAPVVDGRGVATSPLDRPVLAGDRLVVAVHDGVVVLDAGTGDEVDRRQGPSTSTGAIVASNVGVVTCLVDGSIALLP